ncbi:PAS domain-containing hybrid sensor histidine kinase/response regulator [Paremcibacter congregatus]|uniref:histidine kinase n=1 Tax=Paremcibacter congregatus TaxID=2043170 RepID=A0A2G4YVG9_9PROT|nr:histidine kinase dimerization/phospho-acceptor domain-containing protein [Paremcibacter congregatus]PHZ86273.1 hypothetical protein CRD36_06300 [Paremcibacter congregatus]QDE27240.1 response regulator [Paremcibacter congregatus]
MSVSRVIDYLYNREWEKSDLGFLDALTVFLSEQLQIKFVFIDTFDGADALAAKTVCTASLCANGQVKTNFEYPLKGTPCLRVIKEDFFLHATDVQSAFPEDELLAKENITSYAGVATRTGTGDINGLIGVMDINPLTRSDLKDILKICSIQIGEYLEYKSAEKKRLDIENELFKQNQFLELLINQIPNQIFWKDRNLNYLGCNTSFAKVIQLDAPEDIIGTKSEDHQFRPGRAEYYAYCDQKVLDTGEGIFNIQEQYENAEGDVFTVLVSKIPLKDNEDNVVGVLGITVDITDRIESEKLIKQSAYRMRAIIDSVPAMVFVKNYDGIILEANKALCNFLHKDIDTIIGHSHAELLVNREIGAKIVQNDREIFHRGNYEPVEVIRRFPIGDGDYWFHSIKTLCPEEIYGEPVIVVFAMDVSDLKNTEAELERHRDNLQELVEDRTSELNRARVAADKANRAKSEFLSNMSHELRTPLNAILGFAQLLESGKKEKLSERQNEFVGKIKRGGEHLLDLINEVLDLAKIEAGNFGISIERVSTLGLIDECLSFTQPLAEERNISILNNMMQTDDIILADHLRAKQIILNLISNAVKYNRQGGKITLHSQITETGMFRFTISDTGFGIPLDKQKELFQPFNRLGAEITEVEGTGIGLVLTKKMIEEMNGSLGFHSVEELGSRFWIDFPLAAPQKNQPQQQDTAPSSPSVAQRQNDNHFMVLYIEDNPSNLALMEAIMEELPHIHLISAQSAEVGLKIAEKSKPDAILLDINLPGMDGLEALHYLKQSETTRKTPVIALSASAMTSDIRRGKSAGFEEYLTKPISLEKLMDAFDRVLF